MGDAETTRESEPGTAGDGGDDGSGSERRRTVDGDDDDLGALRTVADYQFGRGAGEALFPPGATFELRTSASGRPRQVYRGGERLVSYGTDGLVTLGVAGGRRLVADDDASAPRVVVGAESDPYVREGRNAFAKFVREVADGVRPGAEAVVVADDAVVGVGRAVLRPAAMRAFETGVAVEVRHGAGDAEADAEVEA
jgi:uncharacterized protein with predicted RNA binding PUA domain